MDKKEVTKKLTTFVDDLVKKGVDIKEINDLVDKLTKKKRAKSTKPELDDKYNDLMKINDKEMLSKALNRAHEIRKFEIELYWKRSNQMYIIVGALFTAFGFLYHNCEYVMATVVAVLGTIVSYAWVHVNKGSKFWQENWEAHIDMLEDEIEGKLYKIANITNREDAYSVSRINMTISWIFFWCWLGVLAYMFTVDLGKLNDYNIFIIIIVVCVLLYISVFCATNMSGKNQDVNKYTFMERDISKKETKKECCIRKIINCLKNQDITKNDNKENKK